MHENSGSISRNKTQYASQNIWAGVAFGIGFMAFIDEVVFHQLLQWHHFYDLSTTRVGIFADGLLNSFAWFLAIGSLFLYADLRRKGGLWKKKWIGSVFLGLGIFQVFDGVVDHKILRVHQVRYNVDILPYDLVWNLAGVLLLITGGILLLQTRKATIKS